MCYCMKVRDQKQTFSSMSREELVEKRQEIDGELQQMMKDVAAGGEKNTRSIRNLRRTRQRVTTYLTQLANNV
jgi:ribosomal protein L29